MLFGGTVDVERSCFDGERVVTERYCGRECYVVEWAGGWNLKGVIDRRIGTACL
jgi:hypothetical protein